MDPTEIEPFVLPFANKQIYGKYGPLQQARDYNSSPLCGTNFGVSSLVFVDVELSGNHLSDSWAYSPFLRGQLANFGVLENKIIKSSICYNRSNKEIDFTTDDTDRLSMCALSAKEVKATIERRAQESALVDYRQCLSLTRLNRSKYIFMVVDAINQLVDIVCQYKTETREAFGQKLQSLLNVRMSTDIDEVRSFCLQQSCGIPLDEDTLRDLVSQTSGQNV
jgi:hypothetical protein